MSWFPKTTAVVRASWLIKLMLTSMNWLVSDGCHNVSAGLLARSHKWWQMIVAYTRESKHNDSSSRYSTAAGFFGFGRAGLHFTASILNLLCSQILSDVLLLLLCSPTFSYVFLRPTLLLHCLVLHLTFHLHIPHHLFFSHVPSLFPSYEDAILCSLSLTAGFHLLSDVLSSLMLSHDSISNPTGSSLLSCHLPSPLSPTLSSSPSVASTPLPSLPLRFLSVSLLLVALIVSCCRCSLSSLFVFHLLFLLPNTSLCYLKTKDWRREDGDVCVSISISIRFIQVLSHEIIEKKCFRERDSHLFSSADAQNKARRRKRSAYCQDYRSAELLSRQPRYSELNNNANE